jgi:hypothetical protein
MGPAQGYDRGFGQTESNELKYDQKVSLPRTPYQAVITPQRTATLREPR